MAAQRLTETHDITTSTADVAYVSDGDLVPPDRAVTDILPAKPHVVAAWTLALICSVRLAPTQTLFPSVQRVPPGAKAQLGAAGAVVEPNFAVDARRFQQQPHRQAAAAIREWVRELPAGSVLRNDGTLASAAVAGAADSERASLPAYSDDEQHHDRLTVATDRAGLPVLPGRSVMRAHPRTIVVADGLQGLFSLGREELPDLLDTLPKRARLGAEAMTHSGRRSFIDRLWKRDDDPQHDHQATGRETVLLPPWLSDDAQQMIHTAALASNGAWANWFDGADARVGRVFWILTDPENDDQLLRPGTAAAIRDPRILGSAMLPDPRERAEVCGGRLLDAAPLRVLAGDRSYVVDAEARSRRAAADWVRRHQDRISVLLRDGWLDGHGWLNPTGLEDVLSNPFARTELALPIARTVALDAWLIRLDPEAE